MAGAAAKTATRHAATTPTTPTSNSLLAMDIGLRVAAVARIVADLLVMIFVGFMHTRKGSPA